MKIEKKNEWLETIKICCKNNTLFKVESKVFEKSKVKFESFVESI